jgi:hypothetical protein
MVFDAQHQLLFLLDSSVYGVCCILKGYIFGERHSPWFLLDPTPLITRFPETDKQPTSLRTVIG